MRKHKKSDVELMCDLMCPDPEPEDKGFEIKCLNCNSINVTYEADIDYDYEENSYINRYYLYCHNCGQSDR